MANYCTVVVTLLILVSLPKIYTSEISKIIFNTNGYETYSFEYETSDGAYRREDGGLNSNTKGLVVRGEYGYVDSGGHHYSVRYVADVNGFQPQIYTDDTRYNDRRII
ncbi:endocuticle structural protein SgAbd-6-like [Galleria mellonella]|uniref:Endocuticle structural protein SgAbd-6-like n=1 Tax=Galleria mellonella TaxID=7137 RepID=A0A6J1WJ43_GALME|nr:endocuticle structural protein SgAbd-6-like [Galleria mellonella]